MSRTKSMAVNDNTKDVESLGTIFKNLNKKNSS